MQKKGDRQRTPRSPYGLRPKRPRPEPTPPKPLIVAMVAPRRVSSLGEWLRLMLELASLPLLLLMAPVLSLARLLSAKLLQRL
jgi:hypothetical protein